MKELLEVVSKTKFIKNDFANKLEIIINKIREKYNDVGMRYEEKSNHNKNKGQQNKWNVFFIEKLSQ